MVVKGIWGKSIYRYFELANYFCIFVLQTLAFIWDGSVNGIVFKFNLIKMCVIMRMFVLREVWWMALVMIVLASCSEDAPVDGIDAIDYNDLNETGLAFMQTVQQVQEWQEGWGNVEKLGRPSPNEVIGACSPGNGNFLVLPVLSDDEVTHVVFYPLEDVGAPVIVGKDCEGCPDFVRSFFAARCYVTWEKSGMKVNKELKNSMFRDNQSVAVSRSNLVGRFDFPAVIWIEYYYMGGAQIPTYNQIMNDFKNILQQMPFRIPGTRYVLAERLPDDVVIVTVENRTWEEAEYVAIKAFDMMLSLLKTNPNVTYAWAVYQWEQQMGGNTPGDHGGWADGSGEEESDADEGEDADDVVCPECQKTWNLCECEMLRILVKLSGREQEVREGFSITVQAFGRERSKIEYVNIQMKKESGSSWTSVGYTSISQLGHPFEFKMFNPGRWEVRAGYTLEGTNDIIYDGSSEESLTILWPSIDKFKDDPVVISFLEGLWEKSVAFAEQNQSTHAVREFGGAVIMNPDGTITCKESLEPGTVVCLDRPGVHGELTIVEGDYVDLSEQNNPKSVNPIMIGTVHTHYPLTWAAEGYGRNVGPSDADNSSLWPGLVYDYSKNVYAGHPVSSSNNPLVPWTYGPQRRAAN